MSFNSTQESFRDFARCVMADDLAKAKLEFKDAWLQNVVTAQEYFGTEPQGEVRDSGKAEDESYVVTGVVRAISGGSSPKDDLTIVLVNKVLDRYKVVNWATNVGEEHEKSLQELSVELALNAYEGKCSW